MNYKKTRLACYYTYLAMASIFALPPILFVTFHQHYGISYTLLGTLVLVNFCTQLAIDLIFSFFSRKFPLHTVLKVMPLLTSLGLGLYAVVPALFPQHAYAGLLAGTVVFSVSAGLCEVLLSPTIAALPSQNPERDMTTLHSLYGYGVLMVVLVSTLFFKLFGRESWMYLTGFFALLPLISSGLFCICDLPDMQLHSQPEGKQERLLPRGFLLCVGCIFLGAASENVMTNWISSFLENALQIPKATGDILGLALFAVLLALTRTVYAKYGKHILNILFIGMAGAIVCYLVAGLSPSPALALIACAFTGVCTSMLWPGSLILMEEKFPASGVAAYALMAAGGDLGSSVAPQLMGGIVDGVSQAEWAISLSRQLSLAPEQLGMKCGMLICALFPIAGLALLFYMKRYFKKHTGR